MFSRSIILRRHLKSAMSIDSACPINYPIYSKIYSVEIILFYPMQKSKLWIRILFTVILAFFGDFGDYVDQRPWIRSSPILVAITDNLIHFGIGILTWLVIEPKLLNANLIVTGILASFIDIDHFLSARSLSINSALHAPFRGIFHCSGLLFFISLTVFTINFNWGWILVSSWIPHHLRDSTRRGIYLYPQNHNLVHTEPLSKNLVRILIVIFPWIIYYGRTRTQSFNKNYIGIWDWILSKKKPYNKLTKNFDYEIDIV